VNQDEYEYELARLKARHQAAVFNLRSSFQYRLGDALVSAVSSRKGAVAAPKVLAGLAREAWRHRQGERAIPEPWPFPPRRNVRVATIFDEFSHTCFSPEFHAVPVLPAQELPERVELLLAETAWQGNGGHWTHGFSQSGSQNAAALIALVEGSRAAGVPAILWNKEDPSNFDVFIETAKKFDWVFTTDASLLDVYRDQLGHDQVGALTFAAQPAIHNPIGSSQADKSRVAFFGSWRGDKYPQRAKELESLLAAAQAAGRLDIYDRNADHKNEALWFPERWRTSVRGALPYTEVNQQYRSQLAVLNVNSAVDSPTMVARRVFEVLASRTPLISSPAQSLEPLFGETVMVASDQASASAHIEHLTSDTEARDRHAHRGYRHVHTAHTYNHRVDELFQAVGREMPAKQDETIDVICVSNRPETFDRAIANFERQELVNARLTFVANARSFDMERVGNRVASLGGRALQIDDEATLGECLNEARRSIDGRFFAKFDDDDFYGPHHLHDLLLASRYAGAAVVGRRSYFVALESEPGAIYLRNPGFEFEYVDFVCGGAFMADREQVDSIQFEAVRQGTDTRFMRAVRTSGARIFSASKYNYLVNRRSNLASHTWQVEASEFVQGAGRTATANSEQYVSV